MEKSVPPELIERQVDFQQAVLSRFQDVIVGDLRNEIEPGFCRSLLGLISAVMPIDPDEETFGEAAAKFLSTSSTRIEDAMARLEEAGILFRRGRRVRLTPDVLADHILHTVCLTTQGKQKRFVRDVFDQFNSICSAQLLRNLAELDWRVNRTSDGGTVDLVSEVWDNIMTKFAVDDAYGRMRTIDVLMDFSFFQPRRILELAEFSLRNPANEGQLSQNGNREVVARLPALLRRVAFTLDCLPRACDLLWHIGRDDDRPLNSNPDHGLRVLADLSSYELDKPYVYNTAVIGCLERWARAPEALVTSKKPATSLTLF